MTQQQQQPQQRRDERSPERAAVGAPRVRSPEKNDLEKWKLPKEGRNPSARPGISAAKRQAAAACVRVGSRVSFNTVVAAILIPSAKDLHAAARQELWYVLGGRGWGFAFAHFCVLLFGELRGFVARILRVSGSTLCAIVVCVLLSTEEGDALSGRKRCLASRRAGICTARYFLWVSQWGEPYMRSHICGIIAKAKF